MSVIICGEEYAAISTEGQFPTCAQVNQNFESLISLAGKVCSGEKQVYVEAATEATAGDDFVDIAIPDADLPTGSLNKIKVYVGGNREFDSTLVASGSYTVVSASLIKINYNTDGMNVLVEYAPE